MTEWVVRRCGRVVLVAGLLQSGWSGVTFLTLAHPPAPPGPSPKKSAGASNDAPSADKPEGSLRPWSRGRAGNTPYLTVGRRIKVEGKRFEGKKLLADKVEMVEEDDDLEIEGIIVDVNRVESRLQISSVFVSVPDSVTIVDNRREALQWEDLSEGMRVKVKVKRGKDGGLVAKSIRYYPGASDQDLEIEAPIERIDTARSELTMLGISVKISSDTRYIDPFSDSTSNQILGDQSRGIRRDDDEPDRPPLRFWKLYVGGRVGLAHRSRENLDLLDRRDDRNDTLNPEGRLELSLPIGEHSEVYSKLSFNRPVDLGEGFSNEFTFKVKELFFLWGHFLHRSLALQIGRQRFRDRREWTYDDQLDSLRLHLKTAKLRWEFAAAKAVFRPTGSRDDQLYFMGAVHYPFSRDRYLRAYFIKRNDLTPRDEDPVWFGISSRGQLQQGRIRYWGELSRMMGRRRRDLLRGYAFDVGGSYRFPLPWRPTISGSYAYASGGENKQDRVDHNFRQTRLQDNTDRLGGIKRYNYYGLLVNPELFNLRIPTVDLSLRPSRRWSVNFIYHNYRQVVASRDVGDMNLIKPPSGRDPRLGDELDAVLAFRGKDYLDINLLIGVFLPGPAFGQSVSPAWLVRPAIQFHF